MTRPSFLYSALLATPTAYASVRIASFLFKIQIVSDTIGPVGLNRTDKRHVHSLVLRSISFAGFLAGALSAHAVVLDFEDLTKDPTQSTTTFSVYDDYPATVTHGYELSYVRPYFSAWTPGSQIDPQTASRANYTGSVALILPNNGTPGTTSLTQTGGGAFNLLSIDLANALKQSYGASVGFATFTGIFAVGGTVTQTYAIPQDDVLHTVLFSGFNGVTSVSWSQSDFNNGVYQFDNINVTPVPEPMTLVTLGLATVALIRKRQTR